MSDLERLFEEKVAEVARLREFVRFVNLWCYRKGEYLTDSERISMIQFHPTARQAYMADIRSGE
jgi:hypothetical protein